MGQQDGLEAPQALEPEEVPMREDINTEQPPEPEPAHLFKWNAHAPANHATRRHKCESKGKEFRAPSQWSSCRLFKHSSLIRITVLF